MCLVNLVWKLGPAVSYIRRPWSLAPSEQRFMHLMIHFKSLFPSFNLAAANDWSTRSVISTAVRGACLHPGVAAHSSGSAAGGDIPLTTPSLLTSTCSLEAAARHEAPAAAQGRERSLLCQAHPSTQGNKAGSSRTLPAQLRHSVCPPWSCSRFSAEPEESQPWKLDLHARFRKL